MATQSNKRKVLNANLSLTDPEKRLEELLQKLYRFYDHEIDMSLNRIKRFMHRIGDPQLHLPPVVHVAGTNGKGSTIATLRALLEARGDKVHVATSPHLVHATERIRLAGNLISTVDLVAVLEECLAANEEEPITFFELFMVATFLIFSRVPADFCLLETGLGGRLDASNIIPNPVCTIITTLSKDHQEFLGESLKQIAAEKAGIMKPGVPCIIGKQTQEALAAGVMDVFHKISSGLSPEAPLLCFGSEWSIEPEKDRMRFAFDGHSILLPLPVLKGPHQIYNTGAALAALKIIETKQTAPKILSTALKNVLWPGRLDLLENGPLAKKLPEGWELWIDGGHNDSAGQVLAQQAQKWAIQDGKPLHLIVAMMTRKDPKSFLAPLQPYTQSLTLTEIPNEKSSFTAAALFEKVEPLGFQKTSHTKTVEEALSHILSVETCPQGRILVTGSLYLLGNILSKS